MGAISIAEVRRKLIPGTVYLGEFIGKVNRHLCASGMECTRRRIVKNYATEMVSEMLTGPKQGHQIFNSWKGVKAEEEGDDIVLFNEGDKYLKITICPR